MVELVTAGNAALLTISGLVDDKFSGFGNLGPVSTVVLDVSGLTRMTSFGVRQWVAAIEQLPRTLRRAYLIGCPTFFVDHLNMMVNFGGPAEVLTVVAPYRCPECSAETGEIIDLLREGNAIVRDPPERDCGRCGAELELDETAESYFAFAAKHAATSLDPEAAALLASQGLYVPASGIGQAAPRVTKRVQNGVTYIRIAGSIGPKFKMQPFLIGTEGEVVLDFADVEHFDPGGRKEWRGLIDTLSQRVAAISLVEVPAAFLVLVGDKLTAPGVAVTSVRVPYQCVDCGRVFQVGQALPTKTSPPRFDDQACTTCGGVARHRLPVEAFVPLQQARTRPPPASAAVIARRDEILARGSEDSITGATAASANDETLLGKYEIIRRLSAGALTEVFLASQIGIGHDKPVAIRRIDHALLEASGRAIDVFVTEAKVAERLIHPNIVQVLDVSEASGAIYLATEYVHGKDLRAVLAALTTRRQLMFLADACHIVRELARGLEYAYWSADVTGKRQAVVHRDLAAHTVMLGFDGAVKLLDFGLALSAITEHDQAPSVGKWVYEAPETAVYGNVDHRSDLFSLGVLFYLLCSGAMPFAGSDPKEVVRRIRAAEYARLADIAPQVPPRISALVARLLDPNPDQRPTRAAEVVDELGEVMRVHGLEGSMARVGELVAAMFPVTGMPMVTDGTGVKIESPQEARARRPRVSSMQLPMRSHSPSSSPAPAQIMRQQLAQQDRRSSRDGVVNLAIALAIVLVILVGAYFIVSRS